MGTTGGDREKLVEDVKAAGVYAVIAPNMGKQVRWCGIEAGKGDRDRDMGPARSSHPTWASRCAGGQGRGWG